jgi:hypothetical protein
MNTRIGIIGTESYDKEIKMTQLFKTILARYGTAVTINSGGTNTGIERYAKKNALELGMVYKEYNPSYTGRNIYSALNEEYYGKTYHISHLTDRYKKLINDSDYLFIFIENSKTSNFSLNYALQYAQRINKKFKLIS